MSPAYTLTLHKCMQLRELLLCWKPGVMPLHVESKAWSDAKTSFRSWPDAFDLKGFIPLFAHGGLQYTLPLILRVYMRPYFYDFLSPKYPKPNASLGKSMKMCCTHAHSHLTMTYIGNETIAFAT